MPSETERGLEAVLEARLAAIPTWTNAVSTHREEYRLLLDLALAAKRRRQAGIALDAANEKTRMLAYPSPTVERLCGAYLDARDAEDRAIDVIEAHLCGGEGAS